MYDYNEKKAEKAKLSKEVVPNLIMSLKRQDVMSLKDFLVVCSSKKDFLVVAYSLFVWMCNIHVKPGHARLNRGSTVSHFLQFKLQNIFLNGKSLKKLARVLDRL